MSRKIVLVVLCLALSLLTACGGEVEQLSIEKGDEPPVSSEVPAPVLYRNPLTGISGISEEKSKERPVAVMVNNISLAQGVQTGLSKADIIYETEVEGGITRLMAVFQDITKAEKVGTVRSARYPYVDLALGHHAIYVHCGQDNRYCKPHLKDIDDVDLAAKNYGTRIKNGLASEHTLYIYGEKIWNSIVNEGLKTESNGTPWVEFAAEETPVRFEAPAGQVSVAFSGGSKTVMKYQADTGLYTRYAGATVRKDYFTGETTDVKNVLVLMTAIRNYPDGYHRQVDLQSGVGYYAVNGTYTRIRWSKGAATNGFTFTKEDGTTLAFNPGNFYICIANSSTSQPVFE